MTNCNVCGYPRCRSEEHANWCEQVRSVLRMIDRQGPERQADSRWGSDRPGRRLTEVAS